MMPKDEGAKSKKEGKREKSMAYKDKDSNL